jgi:HD-GYP domain-containing protein (c-di-GMP phosphodiesterase class II)
MEKRVYYFQPFALPGVLEKLRGPYRLIAVDRTAETKPALELPAILLVDGSRDDLALLANITPAANSWRAICLLDSDTPTQSELDERIYAVLPSELPEMFLRQTVERAFEYLQAIKEGAWTRKELRRVVSELGTLNKIGIALSTERHTDSLLELILSKSREITNCDAGSLYLVEEEPGGGKHLIFKLTQCDSRDISFGQVTLPIDSSSIAGYAAASGEIRNIKDMYCPQGLPFHLHREFDTKFGYRTKSMLVVPMKTQKEEVIGVLQLINAKRHAGTKLASPLAFHEEVIPFSRHSQELAASLASQAAVAVENILMFEGFVRASVTAIELRDPTTFGHSERVATLTLGLAEAVDRCETGPYKEIHFSREDIRELRYAAILHDFGKIGVREEVLVKAKKLYPWQLELVKKRFLCTKKALELEACRKKLDFVLRNRDLNYEEFFARIDAEHRKQVQTLDGFIVDIERANEPTVLPQHVSKRLVEIAGWQFEDSTGLNEALLAAEELHLLSIPKGSLDGQERRLIEDHVNHTYDFLSKIRWPESLKKIPEIAKAHHEKLDGSGYPCHIKADEIPFQAKMMTISDIFDALTACDRPYKRAVPVERALDIIGAEVKSQLLDPVLFQLFVEAGIYRRTARD